MVDTPKATNFGVFFIISKKVDWISKTKPDILNTISIFYQLTLSAPSTFSLSNLPSRPLPVKPVNRNSAIIAR